MEQRLTDERRRLVEQYLDLVPRELREPLARVPAHADTDHLRGVAYEALVRAAITHDPSLGPFAPYARTRVRGAVLDELRNAAPRTRREHADGSDPLSRPRFTSLEALGGEHGYEGNGGTELSAPPPELVSVGQDDAVRRALEIFPHREREVLIGTYVCGRPLRELARALGVSERQVRKTRQRAVQRLRAALAVARHHRRAKGEQAPRGDPSRRRPESPLTPREHEVLRWAARGASARETARRLGRGRETIASHRKRVITKLGARNMVHAVAIAYTRGVLP